LVGHEDHLRTIKDIIAFRTRFPDVHKRMWQEKPIENSDELIVDMDNHGIDISVVQVFRTPHQSNDDVVAAVKKHPGRIVGLGRFECKEGVDVQSWNDPEIARKLAPDLVHHFIEELGMVGLGETNVRLFTNSIHPEQIALDLKPMMQAVAHYKVPIQIQTAWHQFKGRLFWSNPEWVDEIAGEHPEVPIILTKMGRSINYYFDICMVVALRNVNVHFDIVETSPEHLRRAVDELGADRVMFGTDWSATQRWVRNPDLYNRTLKVVEDAKLTPDEREWVLWKTAAKVFKLDLKEIAAKRQFKKHTA
jgi:predicted TIM-barrel fold metal-dependent hydrolase